MIFTKEKSKILKGIAILLVLENHWLCQALGIPLPPLGVIGVFIFLLLSGYGITDSLIRDRDPLKYFKKRFIKVLLPYIVSLLFMGFLNKINVMLSPKFYWTDFLAYVFFIKLYHGVMWYLRLNCYWYVIIYIIFLIYFTISNKFKDFYLLLSLLLGGVLICLLTGFQRLYVWQLITFPIGVILRLYQDKLKAYFDKVYSHKFFLCLLILCVVGYIVKKTPYVEERELGVADTLLQCSLTIIVGFMFLSVEQYIEKWQLTKKAFSLIGENSYEIYLAHAAAIKLIYSEATIYNFIIYFAIMTVCFLVLNFVTKHLSLNMLRTSN